MGAMMTIDKVIYNKNQYNRSDHNYIFHFHLLGAAAIRIMRPHGEH